MACLGCKKKTTSKIISAAPNQIPVCRKSASRTGIFWCISTGKQTGRAEQNADPTPPPPHTILLLLVHTAPALLTPCTHMYFKIRVYIADTCNNLFYIFNGFLKYAVKVSSTEVDCRAVSDSNVAGTAAKHCEAYEMTPSK
jgi:hypothetical protein